jgi:hypothetical protein
MVKVRWLVIFESIAGNGVPLSREQKSVPAAIHGKLWKLRKLFLLEDKADWGTGETELFTN